MNIKVLNLQMLPDVSPLKAFFDVVLDDKVVLKKFRIVETTFGEFFISVPQELEKDHRWYDIVQIKDVDLERSITDQAVKLYHQERSRQCL